MNYLNYKLSNLCKVHYSRLSVWIILGNNIWIIFNLKYLTYYQFKNHLLKMKVNQS
jgi:hypothetical protein